MNLPTLPDIEAAAQVVQQVVVSPEADILRRRAVAGAGLEQAVVIARAVQRGMGVFVRP